jgi:hypothetical protein
LLGRPPTEPYSAVAGADVASMGGALSHFFQSGHALLSSSHNRNVSEQVGVGWGYGKHPVHVLIDKHPDIETSFFC